MPFNIIVIKPNDFIPADQKISNISDIAQVVDALPYFSIEETENKDLTEKIVMSIELTPKGMANTEVCLELPDRVYQICYVNWKDEKPLNSFASFLSLADTKIYGTAVIVCSLIDKEKNICIDSLSLNKQDICLLFEKVLFHQGLYINDDQIEQFTYNNSFEIVYTNDRQQDYIKALQQSADKFITHEHNIFKYNLLFNFSMDKKDKSVNKIVTKVLGNKVNGPILVMLKLQDNKYGDITKEEFKKIISLSETPLKARDLDKSEHEEEKHESGVYKVKNRFKILQDRFSNYKRECFVCHKQGKLSTCTGCYRLRYCGDNCQQQHWGEHKGECQQSQQCLHEKYKLRETQEASKKDIEVRIEK